MINDEGQEMNRQAWPPRNTGGVRRPADYLAQIAKDSAKKVAWPPHLDREGISEEYFSQQDPSYQRGQQKDPNYQGINQNQISDNMDQQMMSQQYQQQVSSTQSGYKVLNQSYQVQQYQYEQQSAGYKQTVPIKHHQQQIQQTHKFSQDVSGQQFQVPIQRVQTESAQQANGQSTSQHFQIPIQTTSHGGQIPSQELQLQAKSYIQNQPQGQFLPQGQFQQQGQFQPQEQFQPQGQFQQLQSNFHPQPRSGGIGTQSKAPISNEEMVKEWPLKNDGPNLTTTYPSGYKLKDELPMSQPGAQVVTSQPAFKITQPLKMRGDTKWPPRKAGEDEVTQEEVREFIKPKKQTRDYSEFFAQNALPNNYPGYRAPPGTQHHGGIDGQEEE